MSQENVALVRKGYEAFNRQDFEAWLDFLDPQVEFRGDGAYARRGHLPRP